LPEYFGLVALVCLLSLVKNSVRFEKRGNAEMVFQYGKIATKVDDSCN